MRSNPEFISTMQAQIKAFDDEVEALGANAGAKARASYDERIKELCASRDAGQKAMLKLQAASESAGASMHAGMKTAFETMQGALKKVRAELGK
jgi:hypothetical protein